MTCFTIFSVSPTLLTKVAQKSATIISVTCFTSFSVSPTLLTKVPFVGPKNNNKNNLYHLTTGFFRGKPVKNPITVCVSNILESD